MAEVGVVVVIGMLAVVVVEVGMLAVGVVLEEMLAEWAILAKEQTFLYIISVYKTL